MLIGIDIRPLLTTPRTGVGEYTSGLLQALFRLDTKNQYVLFANSAQELPEGLKDLEQDNVHIFHTRYPNKLLNRAMLHMNWPKIDGLMQQKLDWFFSPNIGFTSLSPGCKHVLTVHDLSFEIMPETFSRKRRFWHWELNPKKQCQRADVILTPSENTKRDVVAQYQIPEEKVHVVYPGVEVVQPTDKQKQEVRERYQLPDKFLLFLGTIEPRKNVALLLDALEHMQSNVPLVVAGGVGWLCKDILKRMQKDPRVHYIGYVDAKEKPALYALAEVFVYPSLYEGFGFPPLEAMAVGTPVIISNRSSLPEVVGSGARLVSPYDAVELAVQLDHVLSERSSMKGDDKVSERYSWSNAAATFLKVLESAERVQ